MKLTRPIAMKNSWNTSVYATDIRPPTKVQQTAITALTMIETSISRCRITWRVDPNAAKIEADQKT